MTIFLALIATSCALAALAAWWWNRKNSIYIYYVETLRYELKKHGVELPIEAYRQIVQSMRIGTGFIAYQLEPQKGQNPSKLVVFTTPEGACALHEKIHRPAWLTYAERWAIKVELEELLEKGRYVYTNEECLKTMIEKIQLHTPE